MNLKKENPFILAVESLIIDIHEIYQSLETPNLKGISDSKYLPEYFYLSQNQKEYFNLYGDKILSKIK